MKSLVAVYFLSSKSWSSMTWHDKLQWFNTLAETIGEINDIATAVGAALTNIFPKIGAAFAKLAGKVGSFVAKAGLAIATKIGEKAAAFGLKLMEYAGKALGVAVKAFGLIASFIAIGYGIYSMIAALEKG